MPLKSTTLPIYLYAVASTLPSLWNKHSRKEWRARYNYAMDITHILSWESYVKVNRRNAITNALTAYDILQPLFEHDDSNWARSCGMGKENSSWFLTCGMGEVLRPLVEHDENGFLANTDKAAFPVSVQDLLQQALTAAIQRSSGRIPPGSLPIKAQVFCLEQYPALYPVYPESFNSHLMETRFKEMLYAWRSIDTVYGAQDQDMKLSLFTQWVEMNKKDKDQLDLTEVGIPRDMALDI